MNFQNFKIKYLNGFRHKPGIWRVARRILKIASLSKIFFSKFDGYCRLKLNAYTDAL